MSKTSVDWKKDSRSFNRVAELYEASRPGYPAELVDFIVTAAHLAPQAGLLEIGAGTGLATEAFARRGYSITCLEPGENLAAVARRKLRQYPGVRFALTTFEEWPVQEQAFELAYSAQAFHWVDPQVGYARAAQALRPGGHLALFWNMYPDPTGPLFEQIDQVYREHTPELVDGKSMPYRDVIQQRQESLAQSGWFQPPAVRRFPWSQVYTTAQYLNLLNTYSDHLRLEEESRRRLFAGIAAVIDRHGGQIEKPYLAVVYLAQKL